MRQVYDPVLDVGPTIVDAHQYGAIVLKIGDVSVAWQRQRRMRRRQREHIEEFAVCCLAAVEIIAVPRADADAIISRLLARHIPATGNLVGAT
jgi:hypothetical protein